MCVMYGRVRREEGEEKGFSSDPPPKTKSFANPMLRALWVSRPNGRLKRRVTGVEKMFLREFPGKFRSDDFQVKRHLGVLVKTGLYLIEDFTYNNCLTSNSFTTSFTASC